MDFQKTDLEVIQERIRKERELAKTHEISSIADTIANHLRHEFNLPKINDKIIKESENE